MIAVLLAAALLGEGITRRFALLAGASFAASYFLAFGDATYGPPLVDLFAPAGWLAPLHAMGSAPMAAAGLALGAAFLWGGSTVFGRRLARKYEFKLVTALRLLVLETARPCPCRSFPGLPTWESCWATFPCSSTTAACGPRGRRWRPLRNWSGPSQPWPSTGSCSAWA